MVISVLSVNYFPSDGVISVLSDNHHLSYRVISFLSVNYHPSGRVISVLSVNYHLSNERMERLASKCAFSPMISAPAEGTQYAATNFNL